MDIYVQENTFMDTYLFKLDQLLIQDTTIFNEYFDYLLKNMII